MNKDENTKINKLDAINSDAISCLFLFWIKIYGNKLKQFHNRRLTNKKKGKFWFLSLKYMIVRSNQTLEEHNQKQLKQNCFWYK